MTGSEKIELHIAAEGSEAGTPAVLAGYHRGTQAPHTALEHEFRLYQTRTRWGLALIAEDVENTGGQQYVFQSTDHAVGGWWFEYQSDSDGSFLTVESPGEFYWFELI